MDRVIVHGVGILSDARNVRNRFDLEASAAIVLRFSEGGPLKVLSHYLNYNLRATQRFARRAGTYMECGYSRNHHMGASEPDAHLSRTTTEDFSYNYIYDL